MALFSKQVATEPCGLLVDARVIGGETWRWVEEGCSAYAFEKNKTQKRMFLSFEI